MSQGIAPEKPSLEDNSALHAERMLILQQKLREVGFLELYGKDVMPQQFIDVGWGNDKESEDVCLFGNSLTLSRCLDKPVCHFISREKVYHTIIAFDADYVDPKTSTRAPYLLWRKVNVTGDLKYATGKDVVRWQPPHPLEKSGEHRIMFVVLNQTAGVLPEGPIISKNSREGRSSFSIRKQAQDDKLQLIGMNCCRLTYSPAVDNVIASLRDVVVLDEAGRKVIAEINDGVRTEFGKAKEAATTAA